MVKRMTRFFITVPAVKGMDHVENICAQLGFIVTRNERKQVLLKGGGGGANRSMSCQLKLRDGTLEPIESITVRHDFDVGGQLDSIAPRRDRIQLPVDVEIMSNFSEIIALSMDSSVPSRSFN